MWKRGPQAKQRGFPELRRWSWASGRPRAQRTQGGVLERRELPQGGSGDLQGAPSCLQLSRATHALEEGTCEPLKGLEEIISEDHRRPEIVPVPKGQMGNLRNHGPSGRVLCCLSCRKKFPLD